MSVHTNDQEIIKKNIAFHTFMGLKISERESGETYFNEVWYTNPRLLNYHASFNSLMDVVHRIELLGYSVNISRIKVSITQMSNDQDELFAYVCGDISRKIVILYEVLYRFIEWYNENK